MHYAQQSFIINIYWDFLLIHRLDPIYQAMIVHLSVKMKAALIYVWSLSEYIRHQVGSIELQFNLQLQK